MNKTFATRLSLLVLSAGLLAGAAQAQRIYVHVGPPPRIVEPPPPPPPHPGFVWRAGYHRWDGARYVWVPGEYVAPPRPRAVWVPGHWVHNFRGYYWREGHWA